MAISEETWGDAPVTPAPVFAYRALRAVFWGEGEDETPEQPLRSTSIKTHEDLGMGANILRNTLDTTIHLTPSQKRKRSALSQPSPSKSILRTPGLNTPRRALLKDLNVSFKDIRKSASPELARKQLLLQPRTVGALSDEKENQPLMPTKSLPVELSSGNTDTKPSLDTTRAARTIAAPPPVKQERTHTTSISEHLQQSDMKTEAIATVGTAVATITGFDAEKYMRNTEKEMKKLIKYGQKMRDFAKRQEQENRKLHTMLAELRDENKRLKRQLETRPSNDVPAIRSSLERPISSNKTTGPKENEVIKQEDNHQSKRREKKRHAELDIVDVYSTGDRQHKRPSQSTPPHPQRPLHRASAKAQPNTHNLGARAASATKEPRCDSPGIPPSGKEPIPLRSIVNETSTGRLAPDRAAAARARIRQKAELRRVSAETGFGDGDGDGAGAGAGAGGAPGVNGNRAEMSLVDWADL